MAVRTMTASPAAGPLTPRGEPLSAPTTMPPMIPAMSPAKRGAPHARAIPRHSGSGDEEDDDGGGQVVAEVRQRPALKRGHTGGGGEMHRPAAGRGDGPDRAHDECTSDTGRARRARPTGRVPVPADGRGNRERAGLDPEAGEAGAGLRLGRRRRRSAARHRRRRGVGDEDLGADRVEDGRLGRHQEGLLLLDLRRDLRAPSQDLDGRVHRRDHRHRRQAAQREGDTDQAKNGDGRGHAGTTGPRGAREAGDYAHRRPRVPRVETVYQDFIAEALLFIEPFGHGLRRTAGRRPRPGDRFRPIRPRPMRRLSPTLLFALLTSATAWAQPEVGASQPQAPLAIDYAVAGTDSYDPAIPTPQDVLGYTIGERHTRPEEVVRYVEAVAAASPRVEVGFHGTTYEGRRLVHAVVTSPANHGRLEQVQAQNVALSEAPGTVSDAQIAQMPVVVFQGYSVHGNEASGTEAALVWLYHLAAAQGAEIDRQLDEAVVLLVPMLNPDGRDRFVDWVNGSRGTTPVADPRDREHVEPWPYGRTNHYLFDVNRDWLPTELKESRGRMAWWHAWRPQVTTDHHEMGSESTFFFQPGIPSRTNPNTPEATVALTGAIAAYHAAELDRIGSLYYSEEGYDDFYYGKGSTYPDVNGGVGILFEQASSRALLRDTDANGRLDYAFTVRNQVATSASTLRAAVAAPRAAASATCATSTPSGGAAPTSST